MTNDELERVMNFIIARQEQGAEQLAQAETIINALAQNQRQTDEQLAALAASHGDHDERIARFERSYSAIADLLQKHDGQIDALTGAVNQLTDTVNRYITARGNGHDNGQG